MRNATLILIGLFGIICCLGQLNMAQAEIKWTGNVNPADPMSWTSSFDDGCVGQTADGTLTVNANSDFYSNKTYFGYNNGVTGEGYVDGAGSTWDCMGSCYVGYSGNGAVDLSNGGHLYSYGSTLGYHSGSTGVINVDGAGSQFRDRMKIWVGRNGTGIVNVTNGGEVQSGPDGLTIDYDGDGDSFINMSSGGMLTLSTFNATGPIDSLADFLDLIEGTGAVRYWDDSIADWAHISGATLGSDYTLNPMSPGMGPSARLTVLAPGPTVPEPSVLMALLGMAGCVLLRRGNRNC